jgi:polar amino acid transport system substrate-binding protein
VAPISAYSAGGNQYISVVSGSAGSQQTPNAPTAKKSFVTAYRLGPVPSAIANTTASQVAVAAANTSNAASSVGSAPYTSAQVAAGLTGASFGSSHLNLMQVRTIVTTQMPLTAPGSLKPSQYASIMAYLSSYDCVQVAQGGAQPFPTTGQPQFSKVFLGGRACPPKPPGHE